MSQLTLDVQPELRRQRFVRPDGSPLTGAFAKQAKALGLPISCASCGTSREPPEELTFVSCGGSSGGLFLCRGHLRRSDIDEFMGGGDSR